MSRDPALSDAMKRADDALSAMRSGDPQPYINCWAASPDATLFGPCSVHGRHSPDRAQIRPCTRGLRSARSPRARRRRAKRWSSG